MLRTAWALAAAGFWLVPDQKIVRAKLVAVQLAVLLAGALLARRRAGQGLSGPLDLPVGLLALAGLAFWGLTPDLGAAQIEAARLLLCGLTYWAASRSFAEDGPEPFLAAWTAAAAACAAWGLWELANGDARPFASFGNPIFLGTALAASLPCAVEGGLRDRRRRPAWGAAAVLQASCLLATRSRAGVFGLLAALGLWALARLDGRRRPAAALALACAAAAAAWAFRGREWTHGLIWRDSLSLWLSRPWLGCGLGRFHVEFPAFASEALKARWPEGRVVVNFAHNEYLQTLVETGPLGLLALAGVPVSAWLAMSRDAERTGRGARDAAASGALALFAAAIVSPDLRLGASGFAAFALLGAAARLSPAGEAWPAVAPASALLVFAALAAQPVIAVRRNAAEAPFHAAVDAGTLRATESRAAASPGDADAAERLGFLRAKASDFAGARAAFERAAALDPSRPGPLNNLGNIAYLTGDHAGAVSWWEKSLAAAPEQIDARLNLAKLLCERGRLKECAGHLDEVLRREPSNAKARVLYKKMVE